MPSTKPMLHEPDQGREAGRRVDKRIGFDKSTKREIVFIHASVVQGAEVLMVGTDAWAQVVSDHAGAEGGMEHEELGDETRGRRQGRRRKLLGPCLLFRSPLPSRPALWHPSFL